MNFDLAQLYILILVRFLYITRVSIDVIIFYVYKDNYTLCENK